MHGVSAPPRVVALLGPTNTGKTHYAIERMLGHGTGMIGFPLRLLARENYDRVVKLKGAAAVALVTGEEKIVPPRARYFLCTVESMPLDMAVDFLAVDEIQMAADPERGHIFTDRLLLARGRHETILIGAETIARLIRRLVPEAEFMNRPRLSQLAYAGHKKLTRLPRRSAIVGFSAAQVYELAELVRRRRGGTAVVLGALSPRTRNAQVEMYQAGEVDYLVATDAIGMGLNMDIDHVAFSSLAKFDGRRRRRLDAQELAQIAGRAGRHMNDGSFGTTAWLEGLDPETVAAIEGHRFRALERLHWRNVDLDFASPAALLRSLDAPPPSPVLARARPADDQLALAALVHDEEVTARARGPAGVRLLWEVCQIPDFRKLLAESHTRLLKRIFLHLTEPAGRLPTDWVAKQVARADRTDGDIETLTGRIADIRTWTYVSHRPDWLADAARWQDEARAIEDRLSDALHERLTARFVDRRAAVLVRRMADGGDLIGAVDSAGEVLVEGQYVGRLKGFRFEADAAALREDGRQLAAAANRALREDIARRVALLEAAPDAAFGFDAEGRILWDEAPAGRLKRGTRPLSPAVEPIASDLLSAPLRERVRVRLDALVKAELKRRLAPLTDLEAKAPAGPARGLAFQLAEALGAAPRSQLEPLIAGLGAAERKGLAALGVRLGQMTVYVAGIAKTPALRLRRLLWQTWAETPAPALHGRARSFAAEPGARESAYLAVGYRPLGALAIRADRLEALAVEARKRGRQGAFPAAPELAALVGLAPEALAPVLEALGYRARPQAGEGAVYAFAGRRRSRPRKATNGKSAAGKNGNGKPAKAARRRKARPPAASDSPFAILRHLVEPK